MKWKVTPVEAATIIRETEHSRHIRTRRNSFLQKRNGFTGAEIQEVLLWAEFFDGGFNLSYEVETQ